MNARPNIPGIIATSPQAIERAAQMWSDKLLAQHLEAADRLEANDDTARRNVNDHHMAEALAMVQENLQNQIAAGKVSVYDASLLTALLERVEEVAIECSWADLCRDEQ